MKNEPPEEWRDIAGYEDIYQVSNLGRVRSLERLVQQRDGCKRPYRIPPRVLKPKRRRNGYLCVNLATQGETQTHNIHRLVAQAFVPNPDNLPTVNHRDEDKTNNRADNLEWCSQATNNTYGTRPRRVRMSQPHRRPVVMIGDDGKAVRTFPTMKDAARFVLCLRFCERHDLKTVNNNIRAVCHRYRWRHTAYGYRWQFADNP